MKTPSICFIIISLSIPSRDEPKQGAHSNSSALNLSDALDSLKSIHSRNEPKQGTYSNGPVWNVSDALDSSKSIHSRSEPKQALNQMVLP